MPSGSAQWAYGCHNAPEARCALCGAVNALRLDSEGFQCSDPYICERNLGNPSSKQKLRLDEPTSGR